MNNKYLFNDKEYTDTNELISEIDNNLDIGDSYDIMLDECNERVNICGDEYKPSVALQRIDSHSYDCGRNAYITWALGRIKNAIESLSIGGKYACYNIEVKCI